MDETNELQKAIDNIQNNGAVDGADGAANELEAQIQSQMGTPPMPPVEGEAFAVPEQVSEEGVFGVPGQAPAEGAFGVDFGAGVPAEAPVAPETVPTEGIGLEPRPIVAEAPVEAGAEVQAADKQAEIEQSMMNDIPEIKEEPMIKSEEVEPVVSKSGSGDTSGIKAEMMRELFPIMDEVEMEPEQKYDVLNEMLKTTGDKEIIKKAFEEVKKFPDKKRKAKELLHLIEEA